MTKQSVHVTISGKVQGVWYRAWVLGAAQRHGLSGWVRNKDDGDVEAVFCGDEDIVEQMIDQCWQGSPQSSVNEIITHKTDLIEDDKFIVIK